MEPAPVLREAFELCMSHERALQITFAIYLLVNSTLPMFDFVSDILVTIEFLSSPIPHLQVWGKVSVWFMSMCAFTNLWWFFWMIDVHPDRQQDRQWCKRSFALNACIGFTVTVLNVRAQAVACVMIWKFSRGATLSELMSQQTGHMGVDADVGGMATFKTIAFIKLIELIFETTPELVLQFYVLMYQKYSDGTPVDSDPLLLASIVVSFFTLVSGFSLIFLWNNTALVEILGGLYFACMLCARFSVIAFLFLQYGAYASIFVVVAFLARVIVVAWKASDDWCDEITIAIFDAPVTFIAPVGKDKAQGEPRAAAHLAGKDLSRVDSVLFSEDALYVLALHTVESVIAVVTLLTVQGRSVEPWGERQNTTTVQLTVTPSSVWLGIVLPFCMGLFVLLCTAAAHKRGLNDLVEADEGPGAPPQRPPPPQVTFRHKPSMRNRRSQAEDAEASATGTSAANETGDKAEEVNVRAGPVVMSSELVTSNPLRLDAKTMEILRRSASDVDEQVRMVT